MKFKKFEKNLRWYKTLATLKSNSNTYPNSLFVNRYIITNITSIIETFDNFFVNVGSNLASKIPKMKTLLVST